MDIATSYLRYVVSLCVLRDDVSNLWSSVSSFHFLLICVDVISCCCYYFAMCHFMFLLLINYNIILCSHRFMPSSFHVALTNLCRHSKALSIIEINIPCTACNFMTSSFLVCNADTWRHQSAFPLRIHDFYSTFLALVITIPSSLNRYMTSLLQLASTTMRYRYSRLLLNQEASPLHVPLLQNASSPSLLHLHFCDVIILRNSFDNIWRHHF